MANKTINQLTPVSTITGDYELAVYDTDNNSTKKATIDQVLSNITIIGEDSLNTTAQTLIGAINEHQTDISTLNNNLTKSSSQLTISPGFTATTNWCRKYGQIVQFYLEISSGTLSESGWNTVATLPENYRSSLYFNFIGLNNSSIGAIQCNTDIDGSIHIYKSSTLTSSINVRLYCTFII